jgi:hypothetical protein
LHARCSDRASTPTASYRSDRCHLLPASTRRTCSRHPVCNTHSWRPGAGIAHATAARPPATSRCCCRPTLPTSRHLRSTRRTCSRRPCAYPLAIGPEEKPFTPLLIAAVEFSPLRSSSPSPPSLATVDQARRCSPTSPTEPTTADRLPHRCTPPPDRHHRREPATVSLLPPFAPNRITVDRVYSRGFSLPCLHIWAETPKGAGPLGRVGRALLWAAPKCTVPFLNYLSNSFELIQIKFKSILNLVKLSEFCFPP